MMAVNSVGSYGVIDINSGKIRVAGHRGSWGVIDLCNTDQGQMFLLEHETYGDEAACLIVDVDLKVIVDDVWNGFDDLDIIDIPWFGNDKE